LLKDNGVRATVIEPAPWPVFPASPPASEVPEQFRIGFCTTKPTATRSRRRSRRQIGQHRALPRKKVPIEQLADAIGKISERAAKRAARASRSSSSRIPACPIS